MPIPHIQSEEDIAVDAAIQAMMESMHKCYSHYHLLRGLHEGAKVFPNAVSEHEVVLYQIWNAGIQALVAATGTLLERGDKKKASIEATLVLVRRQKRSGIQPMLKLVQGEIESDEGVLYKLLQWRNNAIAHWTQQGRNPDFYTKNKFNIADIKDGLDRIQFLINEISRNTISVHNTVEDSSSHLIEDGIHFMRSLEIATAID